MWWLTTAGGVILGVASLISPTATMRSTAWIALIVLSCIGVLYGIRQNKPSSTTPWYVLAAGLALFVVSNAMIHPTWGGGADLKIPADIVSMLAYSTLGVAALGLVRCQVPGGDREGAIDGAIVMVALATVLSGTVFAPSTAVTNGPVGRVLVVVGPLMLASITASTLRLLFVGSTRVLSTWLVVSAAVAGLVGNVAAALSMTSSSYVQGEWPDAFIAWAFLAVAVAALHPSMRHLTEAAAPGEPRLTHARLAILAASLLSAPIAHIVSYREDGSTIGSAEIPLLASIVLCLLVVWRLWRLVIERETVRDEMRRRAVHDALTGLPNRTLLLDRMACALVGAQRADHRVGVLFIDLDGFKRINDDFGHGTGDQLLMAVSTRLLQVLASGDTLARLSGDEFVIVAADTDEPALLALGERIVAVLAERFRLANGDCQVGVSVGMTLSTAGDTPERLLAEADAAMYHAKRSGDSTCALFDGVLGESLRRRRQLEVDLKGAVGRGEMHLVFQPIRSLVGDAGIVAVEALLRWTHPLAGAISPAEFIPIAETTGTINVLGEWVLRQACMQLIAWESLLARRPLFTIAVNVSTRQLLDPALPQRFRRILAETGADATRLTLEVTETALLGDQGQAVRTIVALRSLGVRVALDDFGTGYSSLTHLKTLPLDEIKIDRSFVDGIDCAWENHAIVEAVVGIASRLGVVVVGEGVETADELETLRTLGCDFVQGFHLGRPAPAADVTPLLEAQALRPVTAISPAGSS